MDDIMNDCVDYIIETSNDEKIPFLETIEAVSRSHRESCDAQKIHNIENCSPTGLSSLDFSYLRSENIKPTQKMISYAMKGEDGDCLNITDCDLNLLVDPRTGRGLFDDDDVDDECSDDEDPVNAKASHNIDSSNESDGKHCKEEPDEFDAFYNEADNEKLPESVIGTDQCVSQGNKVVFVQFASSPHSAEKVKKKGNANQLKSLLSTCERYDKPPFSYSCLIAMALKSSENGYLPVSEIYNYIIEKFPYFKTAPDGWKNSIRHNLSLNKCFQKLETPLVNGTSRKACLWGLNESKVTRLNEEISKWLKREPESGDKPKCEPSEAEKSVVIKVEPTTQKSSLTKCSQRINKNEHCSCVGQDCQGSNEYKFYKLVKVPPEEGLREVSDVPDVTKMTVQNKAKPKQHHPHTNDPLFTDINSQVWNDIIEVNGIKSAVTSFFSFPSDGSQSSYGSRLSNDTTLPLKTVRASA